MFDEVRPPTVDPKTKGKLNHFLGKQSSQYFDRLPSLEIAGEFKNHGLTIDDIDPKPAQHGKEGASGRQTVSIYKGGEEVDNARLIVSWYVMPSGRYELTAYVS